MSSKDTPELVLLPSEERQIYSREVWTGENKSEMCLFEDGAGELLVGTPQFYGNLQNGTFKPRPDDVWVATYPKAGTHWITEIALNVFARLDEKGVKERRTAMFDQGGYRPEAFVVKTDVEGTGLIGKMNGYNSTPRLFATHIPQRHFHDYILKNNKMIIVMRNPKDSCVSFYHFHRMCADFGNTSATFSQFLQAFLRKELIFGDWFSFNKEFWKSHKNSSNFLFIHFEDLKKNPVEQVERVAKFLGAELSKAEVQKIVVKTSFKNMDKELEGFMSGIEEFDESISKFMRKGEIGDWKKHFTVAENEMFEEFVRKELADVPDLTFTYE